MGTNGTERTNWYCAHQNGVLMRGGFIVLDGKTYFFDANGLSYRKRWYVDGNGDRYYMDENGILQTGWFSIKGTNSKGEEYENRYYAQADGKVLKGGIHTVDDKQYYFDNNGLLYVNVGLTWIQRTVVMQVRMAFFVRMNGSALSKPVQMVRSIPTGIMRMIRESPIEKARLL